MNPVIIGNATLYLGDCLEILPTLPQMDAVITDPPYGIGYDKQHASKKGGEINGKGHRRVARKIYAATDWDKPLGTEIIKAVLNSGKTQIIFGGNYFLLPPQKCWLVWDKETNGNFADCELAWTNLPGTVKRLRHLWSGFAREGNEKRFDHPTQKPIRVMRWCIEQAGAPQTIIDPFMGSGTTGVAAVQMGRQFIGIEREPRYFDIACRRIEDAQKQAQLFPTDPAPVRREQVALSFDCSV